MKTVNIEENEVVCKSSSLMYRNCSMGDGGICVLDPTSKQETIGILKNRMIYTIYGYLIIFLGLLLCAESNN